MKTISIILLVVLSACLLVNLAIKIDVVASVLPGWHTSLISPLAKTLLVLIFNVVLPVYFALRFRLWRKWFVPAYAVAVNGLYVIGLWLSLRIRDNIHLEVSDYLIFLDRISWLFVSTLVLHIIFYGYLVWFFGRGGMRECGEVKL